MKRTLATSLVLALATVSLLRGQAPDNKRSLSEAKRRFFEAEERAGTVLRDVAIEGFLDTADEDRQLLRDKLRPVLEESFDARQRLQRAELEGLRRRLTEIEQAIAVREKSKAAIVSARLDNLLLSMNGAPATLQNVQNGGVKSQAIRTAPESPFYRGQSSASARGTRQPREVAEATQEQSKTASDAQFDLETRERLAQIDLQEAQEEYDAAEKQLQWRHKLKESGAVPQGEITAYEKDRRRAKAELDRAKVKVEGVARQRELAAKAAVADAEGERNMAVGMVRQKEGNRNGAQERLKEAEADLEAATAKRDYELKQGERIQKLFDSKAVEATVVEEQKQKLAAADAAWANARSKVKTANAYLKDTERQLEEARAAVPAAEEKLREA